MRELANKTFLEKVINQFSRTARTQEMKGIEKYGHELQPMENKYDWLEMAKEELIDGFKYLAAEKERRDKLVKGIESKILLALKCRTDGGRCCYLTEALEELKRLRGQ
ncbi:MAG: hypothetical protein Q8911_01360 [Bacillota bacterium]|nr:hypothetical protein [Bacillota bacterium]